MVSLPSRRDFIRVFGMGTWAAVLGACAQPAPQGQPTAAAPAAKPAEAPKPAAGAPAAAQPAAKPAAQQAPAQPGQVIQLKFQSGFAQQDPFHLMGADWINKLTEMSGGKFKIDLLPNGAVVPAGQVIDAVHQGLLDGGIGVPAYWFGKNKAISLFGTGPSFGMDADMMIGWNYYGGGQAMYEELIQKNLGLDVVSFFQSPMPTQPLGWFKNEITSPDDLKGLKYRTVGLSADLFKELGVAVTILAGPDIVPALERGVIDAAEFNNPSSDRVLGFQDVAKVMMVQSYHQPVEYLEFLMNKKRFDSLPADVKAIFRYAAMAQSADSGWKYFMDANSKDYADFKKAGVKIVKTPDSVLQAQLNGWTTIIDRESKDPFFKKVLDSQRAWAQRVVPLRTEIMVQNAMAFKHFFGGA